MVLVVDQEKVNETVDELERAGETVHVVGTVIERDEKRQGCVLKNMDTWK